MMEISMTIDARIKNADDLSEMIARMDKKQRDLFYNIIVERYPNLANDMSVAIGFALQDHHHKKE